jgi:hypothetical protein
MALPDMKIEVFKLTDKDLIHRLSQVAEEFEMKATHLSVSTPVGGPYTQSSLEVSPASDLGQLLDLNSEVFRGFEIHFNLRQGKPFQLHFHRREKFDDITLKFNQFEDSHRVIALTIVAKIKLTLGAIDSARVAERSAGHESEQRTRAYEEQLQNLTGIANSLVYDQEKYRQELEKTYEARKQKIDAEDEKRKAEFAKQEAALAQRIKEVNDRSSLHERRKIADDLKAEFKRRATEFKLSPGTISLRSPIQIFTLVLLGVLGSLFIVSVLASLKIIGSASETSAETIVRQVGLAVAFGGMSIFYIRWSNKWFEQHAQEEFNFKRQEIDIDRASWIVELASEWSERGREIPDTLMMKLTSNLFSYEAKDSEPLHPADQLATAIFGASSRANLKLPNGLGELEFDRKSQKDLKRPIDA